MDRVLAEVTVVGEDRKGVVASITNYIFKEQGNIEKISQNVVRGLFGMQLQASFANTIDKEKFKKGLIKLGKQLGMEVKVHFDEPDRLKNMAIFVSKEPHCLELILKEHANGDIKVNIPLIVATEKTLKPMADNYNIPFYYVNHKDQIQAEKKILNLMDKYNIDFIVLARYMRILTPNFVWRYPNRIINIHPSLLPAFPGAYAYRQAYERGAQIIGCTAHFVTEELDQGPIIWQDAFRIMPDDKLEEIKARGQRLEAETLLKAIKLFITNRLEVYWGKVYIK
ncbi:MAG: formyltetrahydrofolate deformylase [Candidatus Nitrosocaldaceae archaeon]|nr:MAG: formyltetrahydrofolate deformylase [Candidatus Nitrosocaldaceae archaeon]